MRNIRSHLVTLTAVGAAAVGGAAIASAATSTSTSTSTSTTSKSSIPTGRPGPGGGPPPNFPGHGTPSHENAEKPVTGNAATKAKAAALKATGGGAVTSVTTDFAQRGYEVAVKKTNGSNVEIHLDSSFQVVSGRGGRGPGGPGCGSHPGPAPGSSSSDTSSSTTTTAS